MPQKQPSALEKCALFSRLSEDSAKRITEACRGEKRRCSAGETLIFEGQHTDKIGIITSGRLYAEKTASDGTAFMVHILTEGELFGDILGGSGTASPVRVYAPEDTEVILIPYGGILDAAGAGIPFYREFLDNFISEISNKYFTLHKRLDILICRSLREKINIFLRDCISKNGGRGRTVKVPFDRAGMADYLCCDRSALSRELSRMKKEGLIDYKGRKFTVKKML